MALRLTQKQFDELFFALRGHLGRAAESIDLIKELEEMASKDTERIQPIVARFLEEREADLRKEMICGHATLFLELVPLEEQLKVIAGAVRAGTAPTALLLVDAKQTIYRCAQCGCEKKTRELVKILVENVEEMLAAGELVPTTMSEAVESLSAMYKGKNA